MMSAAVTSSPPGIDCGSDCTEQYGSGTQVTLTATPEDSNSVFVGWTGGNCSGTGDCVLNMNTNENITAQFQACSERLVRVIGGTPEFYLTLQLAFAWAGEGGTIQGRDMIYQEDLNFNLNKTLIFEGGYDCNYTNITGNSVIIGTLTVSGGTADFNTDTIEIVCFFRKVA